MNPSNMIAIEHHKDAEGSRLGMWLFLYTEIILFGGLFLLYAMYRMKNAETFHHASSELNTFIGVLNTIILITSSLTMALSILATEKGNKNLAIIFLIITILLGCGFLTNKYFEWSAKIHHGIYPNSPVLLKRPSGEILFFGLYFTMTGLHGLHVLIGILVMLIMLFMILKNKINSKDFGILENSGLYWHLVDIIWIFLLPLFYLIS